MSIHRPFWGWRGALFEDLARLPWERSVDKPGVTIVAAREPAGERA